MNIAAITLVGNSDHISNCKHVFTITRFLLSLTAFFCSSTVQAQCPGTQFEITINYSDYDSGDECVTSNNGLKLWDITSDEEIFCEPSLGASFSASLCVEASHIIHVFGYDEIGGTWCEAELSISTSEDGSLNCNESNEDLFSSFITPFDGSGIAACNSSNGANDYLVAEFAVPDCPVASVASISGQIKTFTDQPVENVTVVATANHPDYPKTVLTNANGDYEIIGNPTGLEYELVAEYEDDWTCGVDVLDLILMRKVQVGIWTELCYFPFSEIAADISSDNGFGTIDIVTAQRQILGITTEFPNNNDWAFVDESQDFSNSNNPYEFEKNIEINNLTTSAFNQNFVAIKIADADGSCLLSPNYGDEIILEADDKVVSTGDTIEVGVYSDDFLNVSGIQFTLAHAGLNLVNVIEQDLSITVGNYSVNNLESYSTFSWFDNTSTNPVSSNDILFKLVFEATDDIQLSEILTINSDVTSALAYKEEELFISCDEPFLAHQVSMIVNPTNESQHKAFEQIVNTFNTSHIRDLTSGESGVYVTGYHELGDIALSYIAKYDLEGNFQWQLDLPENVFINDIKTVEDEVYFVGQTPFQEGGKSAVGKLTDKGGTYEVEWMNYYNSFYTFTNGVVLDIAERQFNILINNNQLLIHGTSGIPNHAPQEPAMILELNLDGTVISNSRFYYANRVNKDPEFWREIKNNSLGGIMIFGRNKDSGTGDPAVFFYTDAEFNPIASLAVSEVNYFNDGYDLGDSALLLIGDNFLGIIDLDGNPIASHIISGLEGLSKLFGPFPDPDFPPIGDIVQSELFYALGHRSDSDGNKEDVLVLFRVMDEAINLIWTKAINYQEIYNSKLGSNGSSFNGHGDNDSSIGRIFINKSNEFIYADSKYFRFDNGEEYSGSIVSCIDSLSCRFEDLGLQLENLDFEVNTYEIVKSSYQFPEVGSISQIEPLNLQHCEIEHCPCSPDTIPPTITCEPTTLIVEIDDDGMATISSADYTIIAQDDCDEFVNVTEFQVDANCDLVGLPEFTTTIFAEDDSGNSSSCEVGFIITDPNNFCDSPFPCDNTGLHFDGQDDYISASSPLSGNSDYTIHLDFKPGIHSEGAFNYNRLIGHTGFEAELAINGDELVFYNGTIWVPTGLMVDNRWYSVTLVREGTNYGLWLDNILSFTSSGPANLNFRDNIFIGTQQNTNQEFYNGGLDNLSVWNRALDDMDLTQLHSGCQLNGEEAGLVLYYDFEEGLGEQDNSLITGPIDLAGADNNGSYDNFQLAGPSSNYICSNLDIGEICNIVDPCNSDITSPTCVSFLAVETIQSNGLGVITPDQIDGGSFDDCGEVTLTVANPIVDCEDVGIAIIELVVQDEAGNSTTCTTGIEVLDGAAFCDLDPSDIISGYVYEDFGCDGFFDGNGFIAGAAINVEGTSIGTITDNNGYYQLILPPGQYVLTVTFPDYSVRTPQTGNYQLSIPSLGQYNFGLCPSDLLDCEIIFFEEQEDPCYSVFLQALPSGFEDNILYRWTVDGSIVAESDFLDYDLGGRGTYEICLEAMDNQCFDRYCDTIIKETKSPKLACTNSEIYISVDAECNQAFFIPDIIVDFYCALPNQPMNPISFVRADGRNIDEPYDLGIRTLVTASIVDDYGIGGFCQYFVEVIDDQPPIISDCDEVFLQLNENGEAFYTIDNISYEGSDNCGIVSEATIERVFTCNDLGISSYTFLVGDESNNLDSCSNLIIIEDTMPPSFVGVGCSIATLVFDDTGSTLLSLNNITVEAIDNCGFNVLLEERLITCDDVGPGGAVLGGYTVFIQDSSGNIDSCSSSILVSDENFPSCSIEELDLFLDTQGAVSFSIDDVIVEANDNCGIFETQLLQSGTYNCDDVGLLEYEVVVVDDNGNASSCFSSFNIIDNISPLCETVEQFLLLDINGDAQLDPSIYSGQVSDNCGIADISPSLTSFSCTDIGLNNIEVAVTDVNGNTTTCEVVVLVEDNIAPQCSTSDIELELINGTATLNPQDIINQYDDNCDVNISQISQTQFTCDNIGVTEIVIMITDESGNMANCNQNVIIEATEIDAQWEFSITGCREYLFTPTASGQSNYNWSFGDGKSSSDITAVHTYEVNGGYEVCLEITEESCTEIECQTVIVDFNCDGCTALFNYQQECYELPFVSTVLDYESSVSYTWLIDDVPVSNEQNYTLINAGPGIYSICVIAEDSFCANTYCETIEVLEVPPILANCPSNTIEIALGESCEPVFFNPDLSVVFICENETISPPGFQTIRSDGKAADESYNLGITSVTTNYTDGFGVSTTCEYNLNVVDDLFPICMDTSLVIELPSDGDTLIGQAVLQSFVTDNCAITELIPSTNSFDCSSIGETSLSFAASDESGNLSNCFITVDILPPALPACVDGQLTVGLDEDGLVNIEQLITPLYSPVCGNLNLILETESYTCDEVGDQITSVTLMDVYGNSSTCEVLINIIDEIMPSCVAEDFVVSAEQDSVVVEFDNLVLVDNCNVTTVEFSLPNNTAYACGVYDVSTLVTDSSGNEVACSFSFEVEGCDACCRSEQAFSQVVLAGFVLEAQYDIGGNCMARMTPPALGECQFITELTWGDGTISQGMWGRETFLDHMYLISDTFEVCVVYEELNSASSGCFSATQCDKFELTSDCTIRRSSSTAGAPELFLWPNPTRAEANLELRNTPDLVISSFSVYDATGKIVEMQNSVDSRRAIIHFTSLSTGIYILKASLSDGQILTSKIVKI